MTATRTPRRKKWAAAASAATLVAAGLVLSSSTAAQAFGPAQACTAAHPRAGEEETPAYTTNVDGYPKAVPGHPGGYVHLFYEGVHGYNCAITGANNPVAVDVGIRTQDGEQDVKSSESALWSDPALIPASGKCVQVTARVADRSIITGFDNCGS